MNLWFGLVFGVGAIAQDAVISQAKWDGLADQIRRQSRPVAGDIREYVRGVALRLAGGEQWTVETVEGRGEMFAAWVPGHVFVPVRVIALAQNEAELAGVLAHAMSHRIERLPGVEISVIVGEGLSDAEEMRADRLAVGRMVAAAYHRQALLDYVERIARPAPERVNALRSAVAATPKLAESIENTSGFVAAQASVRVVDPKLP